MAVQNAGKKCIAITGHTSGACRIYVLHGDLRRKNTRPIDILDGRDGTALREWLRQNKQVKQVTRDRAGVYAKAISDELPDAMQIADRIHLHQNLLNAVKEALKREMPNRIAIPVEALISSEVRAGEKSEEFPVCA